MAASIYLFRSISPKAIRPISSGVIMLRKTKAMAKSVGVARTNCGCRMMDAAITNGHCGLLIMRCIASRIATPVTNGIGTKKI